MKMMKMAKTNNEQSAAKQATPTIVCTHPTPTYPVATRTPNLARKRARARARRTSPPPRFFSSLHCTAAAPPAEKAASPLELELMWFRADQSGRSEIPMFILGRGGLWIWDLGMGFVAGMAWQFPVLHPVLRFLRLLRLRLCLRLLN